MAHNLATVGAELSALKASKAVQDVAMEEKANAIVEVTTALKAAKQDAAAAIETSIAVKDAASKLSAEVKALKEKGDLENEDAVSSSLAALDEAERSARKMQGVAVESAIESVTSEWSDKLSKAVEDERYRWEKKYALLQKDYKGIEPRYKAIHAELTTKAAALELDVAFVKAELQKVKGELANEKDKHKAVRKTLKKTRAKLTDTTSKLEEVHLTHSFLTKTHEIVKSESAAFKKELETTKISLEETGERAKTTKAALVLSQEACVECQRQLGLAKKALEEREQEMKVAKEANMEAFESARKDHAAAADTARKQLADAASKLMAQEAGAAALLTETTSKLVDAKNQIQLGEQQLLQKEAALTASDAQVQAERSRYERTMVDLNSAQAEAAALAAVSASGALGLAHASTQIKKLRDRIGHAMGGVTVLCDQPKSVRTTQLEWGDGDALGIELGAADGKLGARVYALSGAAAKNEMLSLGDVILEINGTQTLFHTIEEVAGLLENAGNKITLAVASADQVDMDNSPFETEKVAASNSQTVDAAVVEEGAAAGSAADQEASGASADADQKEAHAAVGGGGNDFKTLPTTVNSNDLTLVDAATKATEAKLSQAMDALQEAEVVADSLVRAINKAETFATAQVAQFRESQRKASRLEQMIVIMRQEKVELGSEHASASQTILDMKAEIMQIKTDYEAVTSKVMELGVRMVEAETAKANLEVGKSAEAARADDEQAQKEAVQLELDSTTITLEKTAENLKAKMEGLANAQEALDTATKDILTRDAAMQNAAAEIASMKEDLETAQSGEYAMSQELIQTSVRADSMEDKVAELLVMQQQLEASLRETQASENELLREVKDTSSDEHKSSTAVSELQVELDSVKLEKEHLEAGLSEAISELAAASENLELAQTEVASLRGAIAGGQRSLSGAAAAAAVPSAGPSTANGDKLQVELEQERSSMKVAKEMLAQAGLEKAALLQELKDLKKYKGDQPDASSADQEALNQWRTQCGKLHQDVAEAKKKLQHKEQEFIQKEEALRAATSKIKELEKIVGLQAASRQSLEELLLEQSEESDDLRKRLEEHHQQQQQQQQSAGNSDEGAIESTRTTDDDAKAAAASLSARLVECEQLLSLGIFERQALQELIDRERGNWQNLDREC